MGKLEKISQCAVGLSRRPRGSVGFGNKLPAFGTPCDPGSSGNVPVTSAAPQDSTPLTNTTRQKKGAWCCDIYLADIVDAMCRCGDLPDNLSLFYHSLQYRFPLFFLKSLETRDDLQDLVPGT